ncbi:DUF4230 domain-containing protein [Pararhodonellum marinum]|uniref:DUF4230 domain-containing protein n=1 Tax=Pararhodonellum marinum TaxID=2755358 RepID=UPI00188F3D49|nr:DUF4230 domain-containing protein [Pararhodonellum marinum]
MNRFLSGILVAAITFVGLWFFLDKKEEREELRSNSDLIQQQIQQVGKLIVTEGYFSEVFTFQNSKKYYLDIFSSNKKALVVANAKVTVEYDLRKLETEIDESNKTLIIKKIPEPEINIYPDIEYYDVTQDYFNKFEAKDYNKIKASVNSQIRQKIEKSDLKDNAHERLMSELLNFYVLTKSMGWTLQYEEILIDDPEIMRQLRR